MPNKKASKDDPFLRIKAEMEEKRLRAVNINNSPIGSIINSAKSAIIPESLHPEYSQADKEPVTLNSNMDNNNNANRNSIRSPNGISITETNKENTAIINRLFSNICSKKEQKKTFSYYMRESNDKRLEKIARVMYGMEKSPFLDEVLSRLLDILEEDREDAYET